MAISDSNTLNVVRSDDDQHRGVEDTIMIHPQQRRSATDEQRKGNAHGVFHTLISGRMCMALGVWA
jgi:hypothetical protein